MAHEISIQNDIAEIAYAGATPWHGLGTQVDGLQTVEAMLKAAHLDWTVETRALSYPMWSADMGSDIAVQTEVPDFRAIVRTDCQAVLGVASSRYQVIQNSQCGEIVDALVTEGGAHCEVAGALDGGKRCWILAHLPNDFEVVRGDLVKPYVLTCWGHDGRHGIAATLTPIRVVCANTLAAAGFGPGQRWSKVADVYLRHVRSASLRIDEARQALGIVSKQVVSTAMAYQRLTQIPVNENAFLQYVAELFPRPKADASTKGEEQKRVEAALDRWEAQRADLVGLFAHGKGSDIVGVRGTAWAAYNAVTEWTDHYYPTTLKGKVSDRRQQTVLFGAYVGLKERALTSALAL